MAQEAVFSVGAGGDFPDIDSALAYVEGLTGWDQVTAGVSGGITISKNSDFMQISGGNFSAAMPGDFIEVEGAHKWLTNFHPATKPFLGVSNSTFTAARLVSGVNNSVSNAPWRLYRPRSVLLRLLAQTHVLPYPGANRFLPEGMKLVLAGDDGATIAGNGHGQYIRFHQFNSISIHNLTLENVHELIMPSPDGFWFAGHTPDGIMQLTDIIVSNEQGMSFADPIGARVLINNVRGQNGLFRNPAGDDMFVADCFMRAVSSYEHAFDVLHDMPRHMTKKSVITNCHFETTNDAACLILGLMNGQNGLKDYQLSNSYVGTASTQGHAALTLRYGKYSIANCVIEGPIDMLGLPSIVNFINTRQPDGSLPQLVNAQNASITIL